MFTLPETSLKDSWLTGAVANVPLINPVIDARIATGPDESKARELRALLELVFETWKLEFGDPPDRHTHGGLLGSRYAGLPIAECPPYVCAGKSVSDYADLLALLTEAKFSPLEHLDAKANRKAILACLILSEAAEGQTDSATKLHWQLTRLQAQEQERIREAMRPAEEMMHRFTLAGVKSQQGFKKRSDYLDQQDFKGIAAPLFKRYDYNITRTLKDPKLAAYVRKWPRAVRGWLQDIRPPGAMQKGRPKIT